MIMMMFSPYLVGILRTRQHTEPHCCLRSCFIPNNIVLCANMRDSRTVRLQGRVSGATGSLPIRSFCSLCSPFAPFVPFDLIPFRQICFRRNTNYHQHVSNMCPAISQYCLLIWMPVGPWVTFPSSTEIMDSKGGVRLTRPAERENLGFSFYAALL